MPLDEEPDFTVDDLDELASPQQLALLEKLKLNGWTATHLWERSPGEIIVWVIAKAWGITKAAHPWSHAYILPDGTLKRYGK